MKKILISLLLIAVVTAGALTLVACDEDILKDIQDGGITLETAKKIVADQLGVSFDNVTFTNTEKTDKDGKTYYDLEFKVEGVKYEYEIGADNGAVGKVEINDQAVNAAEMPIAPSNPNAEYIGFDAAKTAALTDAAIDAVNAVFTEAKFDFDNGIYLYELEFTAANVEYEYEINATTGAVYKKEIDRITVVEPVNPDPAKSYIGVDAAKTAALTDANVDATAAIFEQAKFEVDNGVHVYEIDFSVSGVEYEYEINATTGAIIKKEVEGETPSPSTGDDIGLEAAKTAALTHAGVAVADATFKEAKLEIDHGMHVYEIEFTAGGFEYEYEIDASTGAVIEVDKERE